MKPSISHRPAQFQASASHRPNRARRRPSQPRPERGTNCGPAAVYVRSCGRCACAPAPEVAADLADHGALNIDLRLCTRETFAAVCAFLRECPNGVRHAVLRDGLAILGSDQQYRKYAEVHRRRHQEGALEAAPLRLLVTALAAFLTACGGRLEVLDFAGIPFGSNLNSLLMPIASALRGCRTRALRWLGLGHCRLGDKGLGMLLHWLAGAQNSAPHLEVLVLAWNGLTDLRLVDALLRARAQFCFEARASPLRMLDLSGNRRLSGQAPPPPKAVHLPSWRGRPSSGAAPRGARQPAQLRARHGALVRSIACAIAEGLPLREIRLRHMHLDEDALRPMLRLMESETQRCLSSNGKLAGYSGFCLEELDLTGNSLSPSLEETLAGGLEMLRKIRDQLLTRPIDASADQEEDAEEEDAEEREAQQNREEMQQIVGNSRRRAVSEPSRSSSLMLEDDEIIIREALSEGENEAEKSDEEFDELDHCTFLLRRAEDRRNFWAAAAMHTRRLARREANRGGRAIEMLPWHQLREEPAFAIANDVGVESACSLVRQTVLAELRTGRYRGVDELYQDRLGGDFIAEAAIPDASESLGLFCSNSAAAYKDPSQFGDDGTDRSVHSDYGRSDVESLGIREKFQRGREDILQRLHKTELACTAASCRYSTAEWMLQRTEEIQMSTSSDGVDDFGAAHMQRQKLEAMRASLASGVATSAQRVTDDLQEARPSTAKKGHSAAIAGAAFLDDRLNAMRAEALTELCNIAVRDGRS